MKLSETGELTPEQFNIIESQMALARTRYNTNLRYYKGDNPTLIDAPAKKAPDNRVPCPIARKIVNTFKGYMFKQGCVTHKTASPKYQEFINDLFKRNDETLLTAELFVDAAVNGEAYELQRINKDSQIRLYRIEPGTGLPVYDDTLDHNLIAFVHLVNLEANDASAVLTAVRTTYYAKHFVVDVKINGEWVRNEAESKEHPFDAVPVAIFSVNMEHIAVYETVLALIDEHDKIISSNYADDMERFANAYLRALKKINNVIKDANGKTDAQRIAELRMFDGLGDDGEVTNVANAIDFMVKPSRGSDTSEAADRFERLIYDLAMVINPNDSKAGTQLAGIAYKLKLLPMEFAAADIEAYFSKGMQQRYTLIANAKEVTKIESDEVTTLYKRNIPSDLEMLARVAGMLKGIWSDETILSLFSDTIPNVQDEIKKRDAEATMLLPDENADTASNAAGSAGAEIQKTALNGAQISSLVDLVAQVSSGALSRDSAIAIIKAAFPLMTPEQIDDIFKRLLVVKAEK